MNLHYYTSDSGKNLVLEYIDSLSIEEQVDGYSVIERMQNKKKFILKSGVRKYMRFTFINTIGFFT